MDVEKMFFLETICLICVAGGGGGSVPPCEMTRHHINVCRHNGERRGGREERIKERNKEKMFLPHRFSYK